MTHRYKGLVVLMAVACGSPPEPEATVATPAAPADKEANATETPPATPVADASTEEQPPDVAPPVSPPKPPPPAPSDYTPMQRAWGHQYDAPCMEDCYTYTTKGRSPGAAAIQITASSFAQEGAKQYLPALAIDGDMNTAWCEGAEGDGLNEWIEITLPEGETFSHVEVWGGYLKSSDHLYNNGRLKRYRVSHKTHAVEVEDTTVLLTEERWPGRGFKGDYTDFVPYGHLIHDMDWTESGFTLSNPVGHVVRIDILDVTPGKKYRDTCISEIQVTLTAPSSE